MTAAVLAKLAVPLVLEGLKTALADIQHPAAKGAVEALDTLQTAATTGAITPEQLNAANAHLEKMSTIDADLTARVLDAINQSLRAEVASSDPYVRRMRPTFGYMMAVTWGVQMFALAYVILTDPGQAGLVINAIESLSTIWSVALSVLGIYVYQRSAEKKMALPTPTPALKERKYND